MSKETITIKLPKNLRFTDEQFEQIKLRNQDVGVRKGRRGASLVLSEKDFLFNEVDFFEVKFPDGYYYIDKQLDDLLTKNDNLKIETNPDGTIIINMYTAAIITTLTALISGSIFMWNHYKNAGRLSEATGGIKPIKQNKRRIPDISFTVFEKILKEFVQEYIHIEVAPTLCIEIVSNKSSRELEKNLKKMKDDWMPEGTDIGLVIDPFKRKYYLFEKDLPEGREIDFAIPFTHSLLPELVLNFNELLEKAITQNPGVKFPPE
jgi:Uma2 family endonuclease